MKPRPILVIFITIFIDLLGFGIIIPILPIHASELGAPAWVIGFVAASFSAMQFLFSPFWGGLSDRLGRRPILMGSMLLMGFSYILFAFSSLSLVILFLSRLLAGIAAANISAAQAFISDITPPEKRAKNFGIIGAAFGLGFIFGPPIGGFLKADYGIDAVGYAAAAFSFFNLILAYFLLPETLVEKSEKTSLFINPLKKLGSALKRIAIGDLMIISFIFMVAFSMMQVTAALFWVAEFGLTEKGVGYMFLYIGLLAAIIQGGFIGKLNTWFGERKLLISGTLLMMVGLTLMPFAPKEHFLLWELPSLAIVSLGNAFITPTINSLLSRLSGVREQGAILGASQSFNSLARVVGPILGGWLYGMDFRIPYLASGLLVLICTFLAIRLVKSGKLLAVQS